MHDRLKDEEEWRKLSRVERRWRRGKLLLWAEKRDGENGENGENGETMPGARNPFLLSSCLSTDGDRKFHNWHGTD